MTALEVYKVSFFLTLTLPYKVFPHPHPYGWEPKTDKIGEKRQANINKECITIGEKVKSWTECSNFLVSFLFNQILNQTYKQMLSLFINISRKKNNNYDNGWDSITIYTEIKFFCHEMHLKDFFFNWSRLTIYLVFDQTKINKIKF